MPEKLEVSVEKPVKDWSNKHREQVIYWKFTVPGMRGVPDRVALFRGGHIVFFELKRPRKKPRVLQEWVHKKLREFGFRVHVFDNADDAIAQLEVYIELYS